MELTIRPPPPSTTWAVVAHIGPFVGGFIAPLLVYLLVTDDPFTRRHAAEALNVQLATLLASLLGVGAMVLPIVFVAGSSTSSRVPVLWILWMVVLMVAMVGLSIYLIVTSIIGMIRASRREEYRYPLTIRFVKP